jgi:hypothetical protein
MVSALRKRTVPTFRISSLRAITFATNSSGSRARSGGPA